MLDIFIVVGIGITQIVLTWYGVHVSVVENRIRNAFIIFFVGAIGIGLTVAATVRSSNEMARILKNTEQPPQVTVNVPQSAPPQVIVNPSFQPTHGAGFLQLSGNPEFITDKFAAGWLVSVNLYLTNKGAEPVDDVTNTFRWGSHRLALTEMKQTREYMPNFGRSH